MRIYTGRSRLMEAAMIHALREGLAGEAEAHLVVVPKQLTLQTERTLLKALNLRGSFQLQVLSPERLCGRVFEAAGAPEGVRVDERGRVMLVRAAVSRAGERLRLYRDAARRPGFADRCARQLELIRQAGLSPERLRACADEADGLLALKLGDLAAILEEYEDLLEGRFQDGESEFLDAMTRAPQADFLRRCCVYFYGFDLTPPTLHGLMAAVAAASAGTSVFLPLENDPQAPDFDVFLPMKACYDRLALAAKKAGAAVERVPVMAEGAAAEGALLVEDVPRHPELERLSRQLFTYPDKSEIDPAPPKALQATALRNPMEECLFAAALCRRMAMQRGWRWSDMLILCRDVEAYHQPLKEAFRAYGVPLFLSSSRSASRHPLAECLICALKMTEKSPAMDDALSLMRTGLMPLTEDEADRLANHVRRRGLRPAALLRPLRRGTEAEIQALEPLREAFAAPIVALKERLRRAQGLKDQLAALFTFLTDIDAPGRLEARLNALIQADLRQQAGEEAQVWNRVVGALDQMAGLMGEAKLPVEELRRTLVDSLDAAVIKPLPQSDDAVFAQPADRITAQRTKLLILMGETDRAGADPDGLLNAAQLQVFSRLAHAYLGSDDAELSRMRRFYLKTALSMASDDVCVTWPLSGMDGAACHPGALIGLMRGLFPGLHVRGGLSGEDEGVQRMLRAAPSAAVSHGARALAGLSEGRPLTPLDGAALAGLRTLSEGSAPLRQSLERVRTALHHDRSAERLDPKTAQALYGAIRRQSITRLERYAQCPFAYFTQYGLKPMPVEPYELTVQDEGTFFHEAVREFTQTSLSDLGALTDEQAAARMDGIADRLLGAMAQDGPLGDSAVVSAERRRLKDTARTCAAVLSRHMRGSRFDPAVLEADFGPEDGDARLVINAASGECTLEGRIDRIDEWAQGGYLRVIDYKRGGKALALDQVYHGLSLQLPLYLAEAMKRHGGQSAGVYYFPLAEGILSIDGTDPAAIEKKRVDEFRLTGLAPDDPELLRAMAPDPEQVLNVSINKDGSVSKKSVVADAAGYRALMERALSKAGEHLDHIRAGLIPIAPARMNKLNPCEYCQWKSVCRFDDQLDAGCARRFRTIKGQEVINQLKLAGKKA